MVRVSVSCGRSPLSKYSRLSVNSLPAFSLCDLGDLCGSILSNLREHVASGAEFRHVRGVWRRHGIPTAVDDDQAWMIAAAGVAILAASFIQARDWWRLKQRHIAAFATTKRRKSDTTTGTFPPRIYSSFRNVCRRRNAVSSSRRVNQMVAITGHLRRVSRIIDEERKAVLVLHYPYRRVANMIEESLERSKATWGNGSGIKEIEAALHQCKLKLHRLRDGQ